MTILQSLLQPLYLYTYSVRLQGVPDFGGRWMMVADITTTVVFTAETRASNYHLQVIVLYGAVKQLGLTSVCIILK